MENNRLEKHLLEAEVLENEPVASGIIHMTLFVPEAAEQARPGQFINIYPSNERMILPRPIGICRSDRGEGTIELIYEIKGEGTEEMAKAGRGDSLRISQPMGNGFDLESLRENPEKTALLIGGGVGCSPLLFLAEALQHMGVSTTAVLGFRQESFLLDAFRRAGCRVLVTTEEPTEEAFLGNVVDCLNVNEAEAEEYFACGPRPMLAAVEQYVSSHGDDHCLQVSMEERMGCGYGVCLGCSIPVRVPDQEGNLVETRRRVCYDGPVFRGSEVIW